MHLKNKSKCRQISTLSTEISIHTCRTWKLDVIHMDQRCLLWRIRKLDIFQMARRCLLWRAWNLGIIQIAHRYLPFILCVRETESREILLLPWEYLFSLMNLILNDQEHFQTDSAIHSFNRTIFINQLPTFHVIKKVQTILASKHSSLPSSLKKSYK